MTYQPLGRFYQGSVHPVHLVVESARVAQIMPGAVPPPKRCRYCAAINALPAFPELKIHRGIWKKIGEIPFQLREIISSNFFLLAVTILILTTRYVRIYLA